VPRYVGWARSDVVEVCAQQRLDTQRTQLPRHRSGVGPASAVPEVLVTGCVRPPTTSSSSSISDQSHTSGVRATHLRVVVDGYHRQGQAERLVPPGHGHDLALVAISVLGLPKSRSPLWPHWRLARGVCVGAHPCRPEKPCPTATLFSAAKLHPGRA
jgi:hypothetical protein